MGWRRSSAASDPHDECASPQPDVLVTSSTPGALAAKKATSSVPIVVAAMGDPVKADVVSNFARPGGNITAFSTGYTDGFAGKWLELLLDTVPRTSSVAVLWNLSNPVSQGFRADLEKVATAYNVKLQFVDVREASRLEHAFQQAVQTAQVAVVVCENLFIQNLEQVVDLHCRNKRRESALGELRIPPIFLRWSRDFTLQAFTRRRPAFAQSELSKVVHRNSLDCNAGAASPWQAQSS